MKMTESLKHAQANMEPGVIVPTGFLGTDQRVLADIIAADEATMARIGLDWEVLAARLQELMEAGIEGLGEPMLVRNIWQVKVDETRGKFASPWEDGLFRKLNVEVGRPGIGSLIYNELSIWLIRQHHFLQGIGSPFRIDPHHAKAVLFN